MKQMLSGNHGRTDKSVPTCCSSAPSSPLTCAFRKPSRRSPRRVVPVPRAQYQQIPKILFALGGCEYRINPSVWPWLTSRSAAEAIAFEVATWLDLYNVDGVDLDIKESLPEADQNMICFVQRLRSLKPNFLNGPPTLGYPAVTAEIAVINASWNPDGSSNDLADSMGLMVSAGTQSLNYVENYAHGAEQYEGFPITVNAPYPVVLAGCKDSASPTEIATLAGQIGIMVCFDSVQGGLQYGWDATESTESQLAYIDGLEASSC